MNVDIVDRDYIFSKVDSNIYFVFFWNNDILEDHFLIKFLVVVA